MTRVRRQPLAFADLPGWPDDDHAAALAVYRLSCRTIPGLEPPPPGDATALARAFFETGFRPVLIEDGNPALFTGYYEPELPGRLTPDAHFRYPAFSCPPDLPAARPWLTRREIAQSGALTGRGLELVWLADPVDLFFLQVQGSGRIILPDGRVIRLGFAGKNGHPYRSIGAAMVARGILGPDQVSAAAIRHWINTNPVAGADLLMTNPSYVFFRVLDHLSADQGPLGTLQCPVTALRSIAVDPAFVPLGLPVWIDMSGATPMRRLMIAQDTGSAITGPQRADIYFGTGQQAGEVAGTVRDTGRMVVLWPNDLALPAT